MRNAWKWILGAVLLVLVFVVGSAIWRYASGRVAEANEARAAELRDGNQPLDQNASQEDSVAEAAPSYLLGTWQGVPLTEAQLQERLKKAGWTGLADWVVQDVEGYGPVARIIVGPTAPYDALAKEFSATLWFVYGISGSGKETGYRTPQPGLNLLRIELLEVGNFLPEDPTTRPAP